MAAPRQQQLVVGRPVIPTSLAHRLDDITEYNSHALNIRTLCNVFTRAQVKDRTVQYMSELFPEGMRKHSFVRGMRKTLEGILNREYGFIKKHIRVVQKKQSKRRIFGKRQPNKYTQFCTEMRRKFPAWQLSGEMQWMWREFKMGNVNVKPRPHSSVILEEEKTGEVLHPSVGGKRVRMTTAGKRPSKRLITSVNTPLFVQSDEEEESEEEKDSEVDSDDLVEDAD